MPASRLDMRGGRVVTYAGRDAVDGIALTDERRFITDGQVVWSWRAHAGAKFAMMRFTYHAGDGGNQAGSPGRVRSKP